MRIPCDSDGSGFAQQIHPCFLLHLCRLLFLPLPWQLLAFFLLQQLPLPQNASQVPELEGVVCGARHQERVFLGNSNNFIISYDFEIKLNELRILRQKACQ